MRGALGAAGALPRLRPVQPQEARTGPEQARERQREAARIRAPLQGHKVAYLALRQQDNATVGMLPVQHDPAHRWHPPDEETQIATGLRPGGSKWAVRLHTDARRAVLEIMQAEEKKGTGPRAYTGVIVAVELSKTEGVVVDLSGASDRARYHVTGKNLKAAVEQRPILLLGTADAPPRVPQEAMMEQIQTRTLARSAVDPTAALELRLKAIPEESIAAIAEITKRVRQSSLEPLDTRTTRGS